MDSIEFSYLAGIFDAEGCVDINRRSAGGANRSPVYSLRTTVGMVDPLIPSLLYRSFGGTLIRERRSHKRSTWRDFWSWEATANIAERFLKCVLAYLRLKHEQAGVALEFHATKWSGLHRGRTHSSPNQEEANRRELYWRKLHALKKKLVWVGAPSSDRPQWMKASCPTCFKHFIPHERPKRGAIPIYCSVKCRRAAYNRRRVEARAALRRSIQRICALCSKPFELPKGSNRSGSRAAKWCSSKCRQRGIYLRKKNYMEALKANRQANLF